MTSISVSRTSEEILSTKSSGWMIFLVAASFLIASLVFQFILPLDTIYDKGSVWLDVSEGFIDGIGFLSFTLVGALLLARGHSLGWSYTLPGLLYSLGWFGTTYSIYGTFVKPLPGALTLALSGNVSFLATIGIALIIIPLLYPTGKPWSRRGKFLTRLTTAILAIGVLGVILTPGPVNAPYITDANPLGVEAAGQIIETLMGVILILLVALILTATISIILRLRRAAPHEKRPYKLFLLGEVLLMGVFLSDSFIQPIIPLWGPIAPLIAIPAIPVTTYLALLRDQNKDSQ